MSDRDAEVSPISRQMRGMARAELEDAAQALVDLYISNAGTEREFISCITPPHASRMTFQERRSNKAWRAWDDLREALKKAGKRG